MRMLWKGQLPLARAFWEYAILYALLGNLCATGAALGALALGLPTALAIGIFLLPVPYIVVAVVGVWRSAETYRGPPHWATLARYVSFAWGCLMVLI